MRSGLESTLINKLIHNKQSDPQKKMSAHHDQLLAKPLTGFDFSMEGRLTSFFRINILNAANSGNETYRYTLSTICAYTATEKPISQVHLPASSTLRA
jgi:hypothetical protein